MLDGRRIALDASYIHDTVTDIAQALLAACRGQGEVEWAYFHEPASTHIYLTHATNGKRAIAVRQFPDFRVPRHRLGTPSALIAEGEALLRQLVAVVLIAGSRMIDAHGELLAIMAAAVSDPCVRGLNESQVHSVLL